ncbi:MAG TPA: hypothetical protein VM933_02055 [Acidimicrobiales bacterium]|nr:hypothetical protein [Acidimicrobiales bacterium]
MSPGADDPILVQRARLDRLATLGQRVGYLFLLVAVLGFFAGLASSYATWGTVVVVAMALCTLTLAPAIVLGYAVKAAARDDRQAGKLNER